MSEADELHKLLARQLKRAGLDLRTPPSAEQWPELLSRISRAYTDADHDRYLLERSLELSSAEMHQQLSDERDRLQRELVIAAVLQTTLLPAEHDGRHYEIAGALHPTTEVGGDYYDVIHTGEHCWLAIGDVAGHGLRTALIMMMVQSIVAATVRATPPPEPDEVLAIVNRALWNNIRVRLVSDEHMTCTLLHCAGDGQILHAGAHEFMLVARATGGPCEVIETRGSWLGAIPEVDGKNPVAELVLRHGDLLVLFTDGVTETRGADRVQFGLERLAAVVEAHRQRPVREIRDAIFDAVEAWGPQNDDVTAVVARYRAT